MISRLTIPTLFATVALGLTNLAAAQDAPLFQLTIKRNDDRVQVKTVNSEVLLLVTSPFGISEMTIERKGKQWPELMKLRLHLKGLEKFQVINGKLSLSAQVNHGDESNIGKTDYYCWKDGEKKGKRLTNKSRYWLKIQRVESEVSEAASSANPNDFEIALPKAFFEDNPQSITVKWIDFYR